MAVQGILPPKFVTPSHEMGILATAWKEFKEELKLYFLASAQNDITGERKVSILLYQMGKQYQKVFSNELVFADDDARKDFDGVIKQFDDYFEPKKLIKANITRFQKRSQLSSESVAEYITELKRLAKLCDFGDLEDNMISVQISNGVQDESLKKKLWDEDLTLRQIIQKCQTFELRAENTSLRPSEVNYMRGRNRGRGRGRGGYSRQSGNITQGRNMGNEQSCSRGQGQSRGRGRGRGQNY